MKKRNYIVIGMPKKRRDPGANVDGQERRRWLVPGIPTGQPEPAYGRDFFYTYEEVMEAVEVKTRRWPDAKFKVYCVTRIK